MVLGQVVHVFFLVPSKISLKSVSRTSTTLFCWMQSMAMLWACSAGAHSSVGPNTMAKFAVCMRLRSLYWVTLEVIGY